MREQVRTVLIGQIVGGKLRPGDRINETTMGRQLGVSATPVREALQSLTSASFLESRSGRGFTVKEFSEREIRDVYPVLGVLESLALRLCGVPATRKMRQLTFINQQMARPGLSPDEAIKLDEKFHRQLVEDCPNAYVLELIQSAHLTAQRYEHAFMRQSGTPLGSARQHQKILSALAAGQVPQACALLEANWNQSVEPLLAWLRGSES